MTAESIAVDFVVRADSVRKRGGDDVQIEAYATALRRLGADPRVVPFHPAMRLRQDAVIHVVNVDRPFEFLESCRRAKRALVVSPIHHDPTGVRAMRAGERGRGLRSFVDRAFGATQRELLVAIVRAIGGAERSTATATIGYLLRSVARSWRLQARLADALNDASSVTLLAEGEGQVLRATTGWAGANALLVPNGIPDVTGVRARPWHERRRAALMVGRIEPRKRQLEMIHLASGQDLDLTIVGELQNPTSRFGRAFTDAVAAAPNVHWLGRLDRAETLKVMAESRVLINASWVEVQSLVDVEAAAMGCFIAATPAGHSKEWLGGAVHEGPSIQDLPALLALAFSLARSETAPPPLGYDRSWGHAAAQLMESYGVDMLVT